MLPTLPLGERIQFALPRGEISDEGIRAIKYLLPCGLPEDWDWRLCITGKGEYVGTLPKRIGKFYHQHGLKLGSDLLGQIGSLAAQHSARQQKFDFDFTDTFDWESGDFGDAGSCYWACRDRARSVLEDNGCKAIRFYNANGGYARAWVFPAESFYIVFNGYGYETVCHARILAAYLGLSYRRIKLHNNSATDGLIWINGGAGYAVGPESVINGLAYYDMGIDTGGRKCDDCGNFCAETYTVGDRRVCESCLDNYSFCEDCEEYYHSEDVSLVYVRNHCGALRERWVCDSCLDSYTQCERCHEYFDMCTEVDGEAICSNCLKYAKYAVCDVCCEYTFKPTTVGDLVVCPGCLDSGYVKCEECGKCPDCAYGESHVDVA